MNKDQVLSLVRQILLGVGVILVAKGIQSESATQDVIGVIMGAASSIWSYITHSDSK